MIKKIFILFFISLIGCAIWHPAKGVYKSKTQGYEVGLPDGWMRYGGVQYLLITRDGIILQNITITRRDIDEDLEYTKRKIEKDMLPQDIADIEIDNIRMNSTVTNFEVLENQPVTISGQQGFKFVYRFKNSDGLKIKCVHYGYMDGKWIYRIKYEAADQHYFEKDLETFENFVKSYKLIKESKKS